MIPIQMVGILMPIAPSTVCAYVISGQRCIPTSRECAKLVPAVSSPTRVSKFPIKLLCRILFVDAYKAGGHASFEGDEAYIILCCGMTGFATMEPVKHATSQIFASTVMKIVDIGLVESPFQHTCL